MNNDFMTVLELMEFLKVARPTVYSWTSQHKIATYRLPGQRRLYFKRSEIERLFDESRTMPQNEIEAEVAKDLR